MTEFEIYLHGTIMNIRDALLTDGLASDAEFLINQMCNSAHNEFLKRIREEIKREVPAPPGPGGIHHD